MIGLAVLISDAGESGRGDEAEQRALQTDLYREKIVQCLVMGEYTNAGPYVLETMIHYGHIEFILHDDANKDLWFLLSLTTNLAKRMGYHRDPSHFPGISPFHAEMRRRLWSKVLMSDIIVSSQMGMPRMISSSHFDTAEPQNLSDSDLDVGTAYLPPPRPETEYTATLGVIGRRRVLIALGTVVDLTTAAMPCSHAEVMRADGILHAAAASVPPPLKMKSMAASITDSPQIIFARIFLRHLLYKGQIMLHRRFLLAESSSQEEDSFAYSRGACLDASLGTLEIQHLLDEETSAGGQLHSMRWRVTSSMNHLFLTATMILCSLLYRRRTLGREAEILAALLRTRTIWLRKSAGSSEAQKAADTVNIVLARTGAGHADHNQGGTTLSNASDSGIGLDGKTMIDAVDVYLREFVVALVIEWS